MTKHFQDLDDLFKRTKDAVEEFMSIITPRIDQAEDEHERLYWHHIYEEEEQRLDRLNDLRPKINHYLEHANNQSTANIAFVHFLQDVSLEKFGLHNFEEHLDLALYWYRNSDQENVLAKLRDMTSTDYKLIKQLLSELNEQYDGVANRGGSTPTDDKEHNGNELKALKHTKEDQHSFNERSELQKKRLTVGSLKKR